MKSKKIIAAVLALSIVGGIAPVSYSYVSYSGMTATAADYTEVTEDGITYRVYGDHAEITGCDEEISGEVVIPETISEVPVTAIAMNAFSRTSNLESIVIPESVTTMGIACFSFSGVKRVVIGNGVTEFERSMFYSCKDLESVTLGSSITAIPEETFWFCSSLNNVELPEGITYIGKSAFMYCKSLTQIVMPGSVKEIHESAFNECDLLENVTFTEGLDSIGESAFRFCPVLKEIVIPDSVKTVGRSAFAQSGIQKAVIGSGVREIAPNTFYSCKELGDVTIGENVETIGESAFWFCESLSDVVLPKNVTAVEGDAFMYCKQLQSFKILNPKCSIPKFSDIPGKGTVYGYSGSTAQAYAKEIGWTFKSLGEIPEPEYTLGDVNKDGIINAVDASKILVLFTELSSGETTATEENFATCDINADKLINAVDASLVLAYYARLAEDSTLTLPDFLESME